MTDFELVEARFAGIVYEDCKLVVDASARQAEVTYVVRKWFRRRPASLTKFQYDSKTKVSRKGTHVEVGDIQFTATSASDSLAIESVFESPRREVLAQEEKELTDTERLAVEFLDARGETLAFLDKLKKEPAEVMLQLSQSNPSPGGEPLGAFLKSRADLVTTAFGRLDSAIAGLSERANDIVAERLSALVYVIGILQNNFLERGQAGVAVEGFVAELGIRQEDIESADGLPARVIAATHQSRVALLD